MSEEKRVYAPWLTAEAIRELEKTAALASVVRDTELMQYEPISETFGYHTRLSETLRDAYIPERLATRERFPKNDLVKPDRPPK